MKKHFIGILLISFATQASFAIGTNQEVGGAVDADGWIVCGAPNAFQVPTGNGCEIQTKELDKENCLWKIFCERKKVVIPYRQYLFEQLPGVDYVGIQKDNRTVYIYYRHQRIKGVSIIKK